MSEFQTSFGLWTLQWDLKMNTDILDKPIAFHRCFVSLTGSVNAALMLSQAMYWQKRNEDGVWWFQTQEKWADETGLSRREQETARRALRNLPFWKEELRGLPGKLHFFLDLELLLEIVTVGKTSLHKPATLDSTNQPYSDGGTSHTSIKDKESNEETKEESETRVPRSLIPTIEQVLQLASEKSVPENEAKMFFYHYDSVGWRSGKNQMKNWKSAFSGWVIRSEKYNTARKASPMAQRIDIQKRIESMEEQIKEHPGNPEWIGYDQSKAKQWDREALQLLRKQLAELRKQQNTNNIADQWKNLS